MLRFSVCVFSLLIHFFVSSFWSLNTVFGACVSFFLFITSSCSVNQCNNRNNSLIRVSAFVISLPCSFNLSHSLSRLLSPPSGWFGLPASSRRIGRGRERDSFLLNWIYFTVYRNWKRTKQFAIRHLFFYSPRFLLSYFLHISLSLSFGEK